MKHFFERLQEVIDKKNLTQAELSAISGIEKATISRWKKLTGNQLPGKRSLERIVLASGCTIEWLREGKGPMFQPGREPDQVSISGISYREPPPHQQGTSTEPEQHGVYTAQDFRRTCISMFEPIIEYIAERYGTKPSDIERFKADFTENMHAYRRWLYLEDEKKRAGNFGENGPEN